MFLKLVWLNRWSQTQTAITQQVPAVKPNQQKPVSQEMGVSQLREQNENKDYYT